MKKGGLFIVAVCFALLLNSCSDYGSAYLPKESSSVEFRLADWQLFKGGDTVYLTKENDGEWNLNKENAVFKDTVYNINGNTYMTRRAIVMKTRPNIFE